jgi:hypothetical protein
MPRKEREGGRRVREREREQKTDMYIPSELLGE